MEWQPIETAPKDGATVLLWGTSAGEISGPSKVEGIEVGSYCGPGGDYQGFEWASALGDAYAVWVKPSHWMPLPPAPSSTQQGSREAQNKPGTVSRATWRSRDVGTIMDAAQQGEAE
jgi:hypothetical protein